MALTPYRGNGAAQAFAAQAADPNNSALGKLRNDLGAMYQRGLDPLQVENQFQGGLAQLQQQQPQSPTQTGRWGGSYGGNVSSMRNQLLQLPRLQQPKLQQPKLATANIFGTY